ncbi:MAG: family 43 glycosylhydrolase [Marinilabiliales bacterium]|nr:family 43 glycosylhydrolase [Marinilabiliales bacterium]
MKKQLLILLFLTLGIHLGWSQNPVIRNQFSADPTARLFKGKIYLYPSHDIPTPATKPGRKDWFCMEDYHVFSSTNLTEWNDHGLITSQSKIPWVDSLSYSMWAPDCVEKGGKYYFFFPANLNPSLGKGFGVGVGIADRPEGPFAFEPKPIQGIHGIDPCVLLDKDGQAYIYWAGGGGLSMAKMKGNLTELASEPKVIDGLPKGFKEGPFAFEKDGKYYLTYPLVRHKTEELVYSVSDSPMGPFVYGGVIMDESPTACWTNHQSIVQYNRQWYLFYHHNDYSPKFDKNRSVRIDSLFFGKDGSIQKVVPTLRGVGLTPATAKIELDRYSALSPNGATICQLDSTNVFNGWKLKLDAPNAWVRYNAVDFGRKNQKKLEIRAVASRNSRLRLLIDSPTGLPIAEAILQPGTEMQLTETRVLQKIKGVHSILVQLEEGAVEIDWVRFKK